MSKPKVLFVLPIHEEAMQLMAEEAEVIMAESTEEDYLAEKVVDVDAIMVRGVVPITAKIINAAKKCKVIGRHGVGCDNIDVAQATAAGIPVIYCPGANTNSVAEHTASLMLAVAKQVRSSDEALRRDGNYDCRLKIQTVELREKTLGLVGLGNIGRTFASICQHGFGMNIIAYDPYVNMETVQAAGLAVKLTDSLEELLQAADFVSLHAPAMPETYKMIGKRELQLMKKTAFLINAARGSLVDENALFAALKEGEIAGAGLDVFDPEPPAADNPLYTLPNVVVTPHTAANGDQALRNMAFMAVKGTLQVLKGERPANVFNPEVWQ
jgi:D-3-phosphoglycerate dehydrogenase